MTSELESGRFAAPTLPFPSTTRVEFVHRAGRLPREDRRPIARRLFGWIVTIGAVGLCALLMVPMVAHMAGYRSMVVVSGSMAPEAEAGDLVVLNQKPAGLRRGDLITFRPLRAEGLTTHRIVSVRSVDGRTHYQTKGDANDTPDVNLVPAPNVVGRVVVHLPNLGGLLAVALTPVGRFALVMLPAMVLAVGELKRLFPRLRRRRTGRPGRRVATVLATTMLVFGLGGGAAARWVDPAAVGSNAFATSSVNAPTLNNVTVGLLCAITVSWSAPGTGVAPDGYDLYRATTSGGPYTFRKHVGAVTSTSDTGSVLTTYHYVLRSTRSSWVSADSNQRSLSTGLCL